MSLLTSVNYTAQCGSESPAQLVQLGISRASVHDACAEARLGQCQLTRQTPPQFERGVQPRIKTGSDYWEGLTAVAAEPWISPSGSANPPPPRGPSPTRTPRPISYGNP